MISEEVAAPNRTRWSIDDVPYPDVSNLITEDDTPVDNQFSEKQMRLLTESIHASWNPGFPFVAMANVGVFVALNRLPIVPDVLLTTHVEPLQDLLDKEHRSYFTWMYDGKVPDVVIEIVSNTKGGELDHKLRNYQHMRVPWYVVFDPLHALSEESLTIFGLEQSTYRQQKPVELFGEIGLGVTIWQGEFEGITAPWLRWCDGNRQLILTGQERAATESRRATAEAQRADLLAAKLRELGVDPDSLV